MADAELKVNLVVGNSGQLTSDVSDEVRKIQNLLKVSLAKSGAEGAGEQYKGAFGSLLKLLSDNPNIGDAPRRKIGNLLATYEAASIKADNRIARNKEQRNLKFMRLTESMTKNYSMLSGVVFNPGGGLTTMFSARQVFQARRDLAARERLNGGKGESITASVFATSMMVAGATAAGLALKGLAATVEQAKKAIAFSRGIYGKSMTSGFGVGAQTYRSMASDILGVDEKDIYRFGAALAWLNPQIKTAQEALTKANGPLAEIAIRAKVAEYNFMALAAAITQQAAPAINTFIAMINALTEVLLKNAKTIATVLSFLGEQGLKVILGPTIGLAVSKMIAGLLGMADPTAAGGGSLPKPQAFMKQLPASAWEKMGLVVGGGGGTSYAKQTADNTKKTVKTLEQIATKLGVGDRGGAYTYALP